MINKRNGARTYTPYRYINIPLVNLTCLRTNVRTWIALSKPGRTSIQETRNIEKTSTSGFLEKRKRNIFRLDS
jgi:hypothetical protein